MTESRLVIAAGATGRTHQLNAWVDELTGSNADAPETGPVLWLVGSPRRPVDEPEVKAALGSGPSVLVADDLQWFEAKALTLLTEAAGNNAFATTVLASRRPPSGGGGEADSSVEDAIDLLSETLTRSRPAHRLGLHDLDNFAPVLARVRAAVTGGDDDGRVLSSDLVERVHRLTAGSAGLAADILASGWDGDLPTSGSSPGGGSEVSLPAGLVDAVTTRINRAGPEAAELAAVWAVLASATADAGIELAARGLSDSIDADVAQRAIRAGGLVDNDGQLIPIVQAAAIADLTTNERAALHDRLAGALADDDPVTAARHLLVGAGQLPGSARLLARAALRLSPTQPADAAELVDRAEQLGLAAPEVALLRALGAFHLGSPDALVHLEAARSAEGGKADARANLLGYGIDLRDLRFETAAQRPIGGELASPLQSLALGLGGRPQAPEAPSNPSPIGQMVTAMANGVTAMASGDAGIALGELSTAADDFDRLRPTTPFGITPHSLGSLAALAVGDLTAVEIFTEQALAQRSGGPGEELTHRLLRAYGQVVTGRYGEALAILREHATDEETTSSATAGANGASRSGDEVLLTHRERLLLAAIEAAVARRSGDTSRLRGAWKRAERALIRPSVSWLLVDFFIELLAAGSRLGDTRRVEPVLTDLVAQGLALPATGPGPVGAHWLRLQCGLAADDAATVVDAAQALAEVTPSDERSKVRVATAGMWVEVLGGEAAEQEITEVAERLTSVGDGWEASRLLGQAALDTEDPRAARRMLELARVSASDQVDEAGGEGLAALGLSEREAEVALLVAEGRTHKEIGGQLFISPKTVEHHVAKIRQKLGAGSRAELLAIIRDAADSR